MPAQLRRADVAELRALSKEAGVNMVDVVSAAVELLVSCDSRVELCRAYGRSRMRRNRYDVDGGAAC